MKDRRIQLGLNVDHVATVRQARGTVYPDPIEASRIALSAGADSITVHLREDRRHIQDEDVRRLRAEDGLYLNLEMAAIDEMVAIAGQVRPDEVCLVPEKREEQTTEGGLDTKARRKELAAATTPLSDLGIRVSFFVEPDEESISAAAELGAHCVELHTGRLAEVQGPEAEREAERLRAAAVQAHELGLQVNAGHGLNLSNIERLRSVPWLDTLNIGHSIVARAVLVGLPEAVREMRAVMLVLDAERERWA